MKKGSPEAKEQKEVVEFLENTHWISFFTSIPNETPARDIVGYKIINGQRQPIWKQKFGITGRNTAMGVRKGLPDLFIIMQLKNGDLRQVWIEMKAPNAKISKDPLDSASWKEGADVCGGLKREQFDTIHKIAKTGPVACSVCYSSVDAINILLKLRDEPELFE